MTDYLKNIDSPTDLKKIPAHDLPRLAQELRLALCEGLNQSGGHFAANLGVVELTIALHYIYNTPDDKLIWDVGHQAYVHKMLTGRLAKMASIRQKDGLAPFPYRTESAYDSFGVGHAGTSISAALGMSLAHRLNYPEHATQKFVAIIGDGAMTAGMAFEALNHAAQVKADILIIVNDNDMSISDNVGALCQNKAYDALGIPYHGPVDGHDLPALLKILNKIKNLKEIKGPQLLHVITQKGKGYAPAEKDPIAYHAVTKGFLERASSPSISTPNLVPTYSEIFGDWLCDMAMSDPNLVAITPAMREGSGLMRFSQAFPERYYDVGIAEQHSVTLAAGFACEHKKPVVAIYSTFLQRAYDQLIHDVALQELPVLFAIDRAGIVGDGPTHGGFFDLSYLRCVPNMIIMAPSDANECRKMLSTGYHYAGPAAVRYPRGAGPAVALETGLSTLPIGQSRSVRVGKNIALLSFGSMLETAKQVGEQLDATVIDMRFVKPLDENKISAISKNHDIIVTLEENVIQGGAGSGVAEFLASIRYTGQIINLGLPDYFMPHGEPEHMLASCGLDVPGVLQQLKNKITYQATII